MNFIAIVAAFKGVLMWCIRITILMCRFRCRCSRSLSYRNYRDAAVVTDVKSNWHLRIFAAARFAGPAVCGFIKIQ